MDQTATQHRDQQDLQAQLNNLRQDIAEITKTVRDISADRAHSSQQKLHEVADRSRENLRNSVQTAKGEIEERPYTSMAVAFGAGLAIGKLLDRK